MEPDLNTGVLLDKQTAAEAVPELNGLVISRNIDAEGNLQTPMQLIGDVKITEVETLLKLALKNIKEALGV